MIITKHAAEQWKKRFPLKDINLEWANSRQAGKLTKRKIRISCPAHERIMHGFNGYYYMVSKSNVVFVCTNPSTIITVFEL